VVAMYSVSQTPNRTGIVLRPNLGLPDKMSVLMSSDTDFSVFFL
jgi:hypothetical protein